jgi:hypothetical protein
MSSAVFWVVTPCGLVGGYRRFGGVYRLLSTEDGGDSSSEKSVTTSIKILAPSPEFDLCECHQ